jgi:alpha-N-arabinofuranosidase
MSVVEDGPESYDQMLVEALEMDDHVSRIAATIDATATTRDIGVIIDEWGTWHTEAVPEGGLEQPGTPLDGLSAGVVLDIFNHHADVMTMGNIAQTVNVLQCLLETDGDDAWVRPTYRVFDLYAPHQGNDAVQTSVDAPVRETEHGDLPLVGGSASLGADETYLTLTNRDTRGSHTVEVDLVGHEGSPTVTDAAVLFADHDPDAVVDADNAADFAADDLDVGVDTDGTLSVDLEPGTVAGITVE